MKVPRDEAIGQNLGNELLEENLCILGVPQIWAGAEPEGYNLLYSFLLKKFFCLNLCKKVKNAIVKDWGTYQTRIEEHIKNDNTSHIFKHLHSNTTSLTHINLFPLK